MFERIPGAILVAAVATLVLGLGSLVAVRYPVWSGDEPSHFDYVRTVAEDHRLPRLDQPSSDAVLAIADGTYPGPPLTPASTRGLAGVVYEAFQPPLYYVVVAPLFLVGGAYDTKADVLRFGGLVLYLAALGLFALLCQDVAKDRWKSAFAFGSLFFVLPGNVVRAVSIGNEGLDVPLGVLSTLLLWRALDRDSDRWTIAAALVIGAGVLTKFTFVAFVPVLAIVLLLRWRRDRTAARSWRLGATLLIPVLMLVPWLLWNHHAYGTWTANGQARDMQAPIINPANEDYHLEKVLDEAHLALDASVMQGWETVGHQDVPTYVKWSLLTVVFVLPVLFVSRRDVHQDGRRLLLLGAPLLVSFAMIAYVTVVEDWGVMIFRYLRPAMPAWFLLAFLTWHGATRSPAITTRITLVALVGLGALWWADARAFLV